MLAKVLPLLELYPDWRVLPTSGLCDVEAHTLERHERTGRPLGDTRFVRRLENRLGRVLQRQKPGCKARGEVR